MCRHLQVAESTWHRWVAQYGGMKANDAKRLKELEVENTRLKKLLAEAELDKAMLKEIAEGNFYRDKMPMLGAADRVSFGRAVVPGETVELAMWTKVLGSRFGRASGFASVSGDRVCEADITFVIGDWQS